MQLSFSMTRTKLFFAICFTFLCVANAQVQAAQRSAPNISNNTFLSITDIHFDPFASCKGILNSCQIIAKLTAKPANQWGAIFDQYGNKTVSGYHHDTNYALLKSSLVQIKQIAARKHVKFAILLGDYLAHGFKLKYETSKIKYEIHNRRILSSHYPAFVEKTLQFLALQLKNALPNTPIYAALGNEDSYHGDYYAKPNGDFFRNTAAIWSKLFLYNPENINNFMNTFPIAGYYSITPPGMPSTKIIILNSTLFSSKTNARKTKTAAASQLNWLEQQLNTAYSKKEHVWLVFHVPIGIDVYNSLSSKKLSDLWQSTFTKQYLNIIHRFFNTIKGVFTAHLHMDGFELISLNAEKKIADSYTPAISAMFGNNPAFKVFVYNSKTGAVVDFQTYNLTLNTSLHSWQLLYDFNSIYQPYCKNCTLAEGMMQLKKDNELVEYYKKFYATGNPHGQPIETNSKTWSYYYCGISNFTDTSYKKCLSSHPFFLSD